VPRKPTTITLQNNSPHTLNASDSDNIQRLKINDDHNVVETNNNNNYVIQPAPIESVMAESKRASTELTQTTPVNNNPPTPRTTSAALDEEEARFARLSALIGESDDPHLNTILSMKPPSTITQNAWLAELHKSQPSPQPPSATSIGLHDRKRSMTGELNTSAVMSTPSCVQHERSASSSSSVASGTPAGQYTDADIRVLNNLYGRKTSCCSLMSTGQTPNCSRPQSPDSARMNHNGSGKKRSDPKMHEAQVAELENKKVR
jgi:hypothetical protein